MKLLQPLFFFHSFGYIIDILDDLIDIGLNAINMDQQENMGLELLGKQNTVLYSALV